MEAEILDIVKQVHKADTGYSRQLSTNGASKRRTGSLQWAFVCLLCGAEFGRLRIRGLSTLAAVLGVLLVGGTCQNYSTSCIYCALALSGTVLSNVQAKFLQVVDQTFDGHIQRQRKWLLGNQNRLIKVRKDQI